MRRPLAVLALASMASLVLPACGAPEPAVAPAAGAPGANAASRSWIERSDANAKVLVALEVEFSPERATELGVEAADERTLDLSPGFRSRRLSALQGARRELYVRRAAERDPLVSGDLDILLHEADLQSREIDLNERMMVPTWDVGRLVFNGIHALLNDQVKPERRARAVARLKRYVGMVPGVPSLAAEATADVAAHLARPELVMPARIEVEKSLATSATLREGTEKLFAKYGLTGHGEEEALRALGEQLAAYDDFVRTEVLPHARADFALPPAIYALRLERVGVDIPQEKLVAMAHEQFTAIQGEMQKVAAKVAEERHLPSADYRDVIHELKKEQLVGDAILPHYRQRLADIEAIIRKEHLVTLPSRPARIRLASQAESVQQPAPHMVPPRLLGNEGEQGEFVLPLGIPAPTGASSAAPAGDPASSAGASPPASATKYDDFTYAAASWTLVAHEARPGHELQFDSMVERGVSIARARYAFNSVNVEGWGLYAEAITLPFMPPEGQLVSLDLRLLRAARAFLDPELQRGTWTFDSARAFLEKEVCLSPAFATSEVERYTFRMPGQAPSYFYGLTRLLALRHEAEQRLGPRFDAQAFHDAILGEGLLPPDLMRAAVLGKMGGA
ncbi:MAG TPA: DUF885 domain-containing protein [Polyangiaceae bacterium]